MAAAPRLKTSIERASAPVSSTAWVKGTAAPKSPPTIDSTEVLSARTGPDDPPEGQQAEPARQEQREGQGDEGVSPCVLEADERGGAGARGQVLVVRDPVAEGITGMRADAGHAGAGQQGGALFAAAGVRQRHDLRRRGGPLGVWARNSSSRPAVPVVRHERVGVAPEQLVEFVAPRVERLTGLRPPCRVRRQQMVAQGDAHLLECAGDVPQRGETRDLRLGHEAAAGFDPRQLGVGEHAQGGKDQRGQADQEQDSSSDGHGRVAPKPDPPSRKLLASRNFLLHRVQVGVELPDVLEHGAEVRDLDDVEDLLHLRRGVEQHGLPGPGVHDLLRAEDRAQTGAGDVLEACSGRRPRPSPPKRAPVRAPRRAR